jgi:hypothetical protein
MIEKNRRSHQNLLAVCFCVYSAVLYLNVNLEGKNGKSRIAANFLIVCFDKL